MRVGHLSPDTPAVDVEIAGETVAGVAYGTLTAYREVPAGRHAVAVRAAGASPGTAPVLSTVVDVPAGGARTVTLSGRFADLALEVLDDELTAPPAGSARVRVLASADAGPLDVTLSGRVLAAGLPFRGVGPYATVPAGPAVVEVSAGGAPPTRLPLDLAAGSIVSLVGLDGPGGGLTVRAVVDAAAPAAVPSGAVEAGGRPPAGPWPWAALGAGVLLLLRRRSSALPLAVVLAATLVPVGGPAAPADVHLVSASTARVAPVRVRVPSVGIDGPLTVVGLDAAGALAPPSDVGVAGWFHDGPAPGEVGPAVLAGHVNGGGRPGLFARLGDVAVGDVVLVEDADGVTRRFTVTRVAGYPKAAFPTAAVYGPATGAELRLITCGGAFDAARHSYTDNVVVSAHET